MSCASLRPWILANGPAMRYQSVVTLWSATWPISRPRVRPVAECLASPVVGPQGAPSESDCRTQELDSFRFSTGMARTELRRFKVSFTLRRVIRKAHLVSCSYDVWGSDRALRELSEYAGNAKDILAVEYAA